jgi:hypothetical protein
MPEGPRAAIKWEHLNMTPHAAVPFPASEMVKWLWGIGDLGAEKEIGGGQGWTLHKERLNALLDRGNECIGLELDSSFMYTGCWREQISW